MKFLTFKEPLSSRDVNQADDIERIVTACHNAGYSISSIDARRAWEAFSESRCAGWIYLPSDDESIVAAVQLFCAVR